MGYFKKSLFIFFGTVSLSLGVLGIILPGLPTTPFVLLTAYLYARSSTKLYSKLLENKYVGPYIKRYRRDKGMTKRTKIWAICFMWVMITFSSVFFINSETVVIIVLSAGVVGTIVMGLIVPTAKIQIGEKEKPAQKMRA